MNESNKMGTRPMVPLLLSMAIPPMLSMLVQALYNVVDSIFVANLSQSALTAVSLVAPLQTILTAIGVGTGIGTNSYISRSLGAGDPERAKLAMGNGLLLAGFHSLLLCVLGLLLVRPFVGMYTDDPEILEMGTVYGRIVVCLCLGLMFGNVAEKTIQATGNMTVPMLMQLAGAVTNLVLDPIMIFGYLGCPAMGVAGAAWATVIGQILQLVLAVAYLFRNKTIALRLSDIRLHMPTVGKIYKVALPAMTTLTLSSILNMTVNWVLKGLSEVGVAVMGICYKVQNFASMPLFGLTQCTLPVAGFNYGARNGRRVNQVRRAAIGISVVVETVVLVLVELFPRPILTLFAASDSLMAEGLPALRIFGICFLLSTVCIATVSIFDASGYSVYSMSCSITRQFAAPMVLSLLLSRVMGLTGVWVSFLLAEIIGLAAAVLIYRRWKHKNPVMRSAFAPGN